MGAKTGIQWADTTVNGTTGCQGCELKIPGRVGSCYAVPIHEGRLHASMPHLYAADFHEVREAPGRIAKAAALSDLLGTARPLKPWLDGLPRLIFVGDLGDVFSRGISFDYLRDEVLAGALGKAGRRHLWLWLTKQPKRAVEFAGWLGRPWPENVWMGTSITARATCSRARDLLGFPGPKFLSLEPLWESVHGQLLPLIGHFDWAIIGGESRQRQEQVHPFNVAWARALITLCGEAKVAAFLKQFGSAPYWTRYDENSTTDPGEDVPIRLADLHGGDWSEWDRGLEWARVREMPERMRRYRRSPQGSLIR